MSDAPPAAAAVIIPTRNRKELLGKAITSALAQTVPVEVFVMDDGSTDGTGVFVAENFPTVHYQRSEVSIGPTGQRNRGADAATAPFIVTLDDDCVFSSPQTLERTLSLFDHPRVGAVTIPFVNVLQDAVLRSSAPQPRGIWTSYHYFGGMIAFRRDAYRAVGGCRQYLFMHVEEPDLATRLLNAGYVIRLGTQRGIDHYESPVRDRPRLDVLGPRNHVLYTWYNVPMPYFPLHLAGTTFNTLRHGVKHRTLRRVLRGLMRGYGGIVHEMTRRHAVSANTYRLIQMLKTKDAVLLEEIEPRMNPLSDASSAR
jgi:GT2 family glycosyltransferase